MILSSSDMLKAPPRRLLDWGEDTSESLEELPEQGVETIPLEVCERVDEATAEER